jgi:hypothetical protein
MDEMAALLRASWDKSPPTAALQFTDHAGVTGSSTVINSDHGLAENRLWT